MKNIWSIFFAAFFALTFYANASESITVVVGMDSDYPPYEYVNSDGEPDGLLVELTKNSAEVMGINVIFRPGEWDDIVRELNRGSIDILQGLSWSQTRAEKFIFAPPTTIVQHAVFGRKGARKISSIKDLTDKEVIVHKSGIMHELLSEMAHPPKLFFAGTPDDVLRLLASGRHDYAVVPFLPGTYIINKHKLTNLDVVMENAAVHKFGYAALENNKDLVLRFAEGLAILKQTGEYEKIYTRWLGVAGDGAILWRTILRDMMFIAAPVLVVFSLVILWNYSLRKQVLSRTASLSQAMEELKNNQKQLVQADKMAALGVLVAGVAHEINNPNGMILLNTSMIKRSFSDIAQILDEYYEENGDFPVGGIAYSKMRAELPVLIDETNAGANRIKHIVNDLKDFARHEDTSSKNIFDINICVETALRLIDMEIKKSTSRFSVEYAGKPVYIYGHMQRVEQVVVNLLLNSCQALQSVDDGISVRIYAKDGNAVLEIIDEGKGIDADVIDQITNPFFTTKRDSGGTGLGLAISDGIIKDHGGTMIFRSDSESGTIVTITIPLCTGEIS